MAKPARPATILPKAMFAKTLVQQLGQPVIDQTGITGSRCIRLRWTTDDGAPRSLGVRSAALQPQTDAPPWRRRSCSSSG